MKQVGEPCWNCGIRVAPGAAFCLSCQSRQPERWEYTILNYQKGISWNYRLDPEIVGQLNSWGAQGWELVAVEAQEGVKNNTVSHSLVFKRRVI